MNILNADNRNDVISGIVALTCGLISIVLVIYNNRKFIEKYLFFFLGSNALDGKIKKEAIVVDPIGAIVISAVIIIAWSIHAHSRYSID